MVGAEVQLAAGVKAGANVGLRAAAVATICGAQAVDQSGVHVCLLISLVRGGRCRPGGAVSTFEGSWRLPLLGPPYLSANSQARRFVPALH